MKILVQPRILTSQRSRNPITDGEEPTHFQPSKAKVPRYLDEHKKYTDQPRGKSQCSSQIYASFSREPPFKPCRKQVTHYDNDSEKPLSRRKALGQSSRRDPIVFADAFETPPSQAKRFCPPPPECKTTEYDVHPGRLDSKMVSYNRRNYSSVFANHYDVDIFGSHRQKPQNERPEAASILAYQYAFQYRDEKLTNKL